MRNAQYDAAPEPARRERVLEGEPDHKDTYLTPVEQSKNDQFLPCCSRSKSPVLVLDL